MNRILQSENLAALRTLPDASIPLIYIDPPFNTGTTQQRPRLKTIRDDAGDRTGFGGNRYRTIKLDDQSPAPNYTDTFDDYLGFLRPRLLEAHRILAPTGSFFFHVDPREVHYCKVLLDEIFTTPTASGRACSKHIVCSPRLALCSFISTTARCTTAR